MTNAKTGRKSTSPIKPKVMGRPSKFKAEYVEQARKLSLLGLTDVEMSEIFSVTEKTFNNWKKDHPEFLQSLKTGKEVADANVVASLYERALGYSHPEDDIRTVSIGDGMGSEIVITPTVKHYAPDTVACIFWLKNRQPKKWREKPDGIDPDENVAPVNVYIGVKDASKPTD